MESIVDMLIRHESKRLDPYMDCCAKPWRDCRCENKGKLTIGVGRNLDDMGLTENEARYLLENDLGRVRAELDATLPWWRALDEPRKTVLLNMTFNMGLSRLLTFTKFLHALAHGDYQRAAGEMLDSLWAKQVHRRAVELASLMQSPVET